MSGLFICVSGRITPFMCGPLQLGQLLLIFVFLLLTGSVRAFNGTSLNSEFCNENKMQEKRDLPARSFLSSWHPPKSSERFSKD